MRRLLCLLLVLMSALTALADPSPDVTYIGGTVTTPAAATSGTLDLSSPDAMRFRSTTATVEIPWSAIRSWSCSTQLARHLGVLPTIAVGLVRKRQRSHFLRIAWLDEHSNTQGMLFEVPKQLPKVLETALIARAPAKSQRPTFASGAE
jgi:hypothetical protein